MTQQQSRDRLRSCAERFDSDALQTVEARISALQTGDIEARIDLCAATMVAAFSQPGITISVYDSLARAWLKSDNTSTPESQTEGAVQGLFTEVFWNAFWALLDESAEFDALSLTSRVAALGGLLHAEFTTEAEQLARIHPGAAAPHTRSPPKLIDLDSLAKLPQNSLGYELQHMLVDNGFDAEVLSREAIGLQLLPSALCYLNTRILQMHDVWHLVANYRTTALHEVAISAFQLAQFGHNYSAMLLATVLTTTATNRPAGLPILLQIISEAWQHGRSTPSLMAIEWETQWHRSTQDIREDFGIKPFASKLPADLLETLAQQ